MTYRDRGTGCALETHYYVWADCDCICRKAVLCNGADGPVVITGSNGHVLSTVMPSTIYNLVPNGAEVLVTGDFTFNSSEAYDICGGTPASAAYAASFTVADGVAFSAATLHLARDGVFRLRDATASIGNIYVNHASNGSSASML